MTYLPPLRVFAVILVALVCSRSASAITSEYLGSYPESYEDLLVGGGKVWACRYGDLAYTRLLVDAGSVVSDAETALPDRTLRAAASPDGVLYAVATGTEIDVNPSAHLWEKQPPGAWTDLGQIRPIDYNSKVAFAQISFIGRLVMVNLNVQWSIYSSGGTTYVYGNPPDPALVLFDRNTRNLSLGLTNVTTIRGAETVYGLQQDPTNLLNIGRLMQTTDGMNWDTIQVPTQAINEESSILSFGSDFPSAVDGNRMFYDDFLSSTNILVATPGGVLVQYPIPFTDLGYGPADESTPTGQRYNTAQMDDMIIMDAGESFVGFYHQTSQEGGADRQLIVTSNDYLRTFSFFHYVDNGFLSAASDGSACYVLRATDMGTNLLRFKTSGIHIPLVQRPALRASGRKQPFQTGFLTTDPDTGELVPSVVDRQVIDLLVMPGNASFSILETSTDLENWTPVGLPFPAQQTATFILQPSESRRFYR